MIHKSAEATIKAKDPFNHQYDQSGYIVLASAVRRDADSGRLVIKEPEKLTTEAIQKRSK
jgi:hypothetical protein